MKIPGLREIMGEKFGCELPRAKQNSKSYSKVSKERKNYMGVLLVAGSAIPL